MGELHLAVGAITEALCSIHMIVCINLTAEDISGNIWLTRFDPLLIYLIARETVSHYMILQKVEHSKLGLESLDHHVLGDILMNESRSGKHKVFRNILTM
ncbi:hypothetical protein ACJX0J_024870 [Zea mays]